MPPDAGNLLLGSDREFLCGGMAPAASPSRTLFRRTLRPGQIERGIDQRDVRERLREVADLTTEARVKLLGEETNIIAQ